MRYLPVLFLLAAAPVHAAGQWVVVCSLAPELSDDELAGGVTELARGRVLATGAALVTDESVEESRTALGITDITLEDLPALIAGVEATHGLLIAVQTAEERLEIAVHRHDVDTEVTTILRRVASRPALKRTLKKAVNEIVKPPRARRKNKRRGPEKVADLDPEYRKVRMTIGSLDAPAAEELGLRRPNGVFVVEVGDGGAAQRVLRAGDVIQKLDRRRIRTPGELAGLLLQAELGDTLPFSIWRDGAKTRADLRLGPLPEPAESEENEESEKTEAIEEPDPRAESGEVSDAGGAPAGRETPATPTRKLGVRVRTISPEVAESLGLLAPTGALVTRIAPGSVGERAELQIDDVILTVSGEPVTHARYLSGLLQQTYPLERVNIEIWRAHATVVLQALFDDDTAESEEPTSEAPPR